MNNVNIKGHRIVRFTNILDILVQIGECSSHSEAKMLLRSSSPIFIDNKRIYDEKHEIDFVLRHSSTKKYNKFRNSYFLKYYSVLRIGGSYNPERVETGRTYNLIRSDACLGQTELFR